MRSNPRFLSLAEVERAYILKLYRHFKQNKSLTAVALGISLKTLYNKLNAYGVTAAPFGRPPVAKPKRNRVRFVGVLVENGQTRSVSRDGTIIDNRRPMYGRPSQLLVRWDDGSESWVARKSVNEL